MHLTDEIKEFIRHSGKALILEDGQPKFVISSFEDYMTVVRKAGQGRVADNEAFTIRQAGAASWANGVQNEKIKEINQEIEEISKEGFFSPQTPAKQFYRELE